MRAVDGLKSSHMRNTETESPVPLPDAHCKSSCVCCYPQQPETILWTKLKRNCKLAIPHICNGDEIANHFTFVFSLTCTETCQCRGWAYAVGMFVSVGGAIHRRLEVDAVEK